MINMENLFKNYPNTENLYKIVLNNLRTNKVVGVTSVKAKELLGIGLIQKLLNTTPSVRIWVGGKDYVSLEKYKNNLDKKPRGIKFLSYNDLSGQSVSSLETKGFIADLIIFDDFDVIMEDKAVYLSVKVMIENGKKGFSRIVGLSSQPEKKINSKIKELFENNIIDKLDILNMIKSRNNWTDLEVSLLKEFYSIGGAKLCQEKGINRSINSIRSKASQLGISVKQKE